VVAFILLAVALVIAGRAIAFTVLARLLVLFAIALILLLLFLLLLELFYQRFIFGGIGVLWIAVKRLLKGRYGFLQFSRTRQRIVPVIVCRGTVQLREMLGGAVIVAGAIGGGAFPGGIFKVRQGTRWVTFFQGPGALLIGGQPQVLQINRL